jgi:hypothetical protein
MVFGDSVRSWRLARHSATVARRDLTSDALEDRIGDRLSVFTAPLSSNA